MLCLGRKVGEKIVIGDGIVVEVVEIRGGVVRIGVTAPREVVVVREELLKKPAKAPGVNQDALGQV